VLISELSRRSGVPVATIKYYLREDLLPKGESTSATRAEYTEVHLQRLRLVRALVEVAEIPLSGVRTVLHALDNPEFGLHRLLGTVQYALTPDAPTEGGEEVQEAEQAVDDLLARHGWQVRPNNPARRRLSWTLATLDRLGHPIGAAFLDAYAAAAHTAAEADLTRVDPSVPREQAVERLATTLALMDQALVALHRLAQESESAHRLHRGPPPDC
jgi:DNA-binding transcriptional MerR regulator